MSPAPLRREPWTVVADPMGQQCPICHKLMGLKRAAHMTTCTGPKRKLSWTERKRAKLMWKAKLRELFPQ